MRQGTYSEDRIQAGNHCHVFRSDCCLQNQGR